MAHERYLFGLVAVSGGLLAVGSNIVDTPNELFDEASGRWFALPHPMAQLCSRADVFSWCRCPPRP